jgi:hypothetical protein
MRTTIYIFMIFFLHCLGTAAQPSSFSKFFWQQDGGMNGNHIKPFNDGYLLTQGRKMPGKSRINICISRLNAQADTLWNRVIEDSLLDYSVKRIYITKDHYILITGTVDVPGVIGNERAFVLKTDTSGNKIWLKEYGYVGSWVVGNGNDIIEIPGNAYLVAGYRLSSSAADLGGMIIYKLDTAGNEIWASYGGSSGDHANAVLYNPVDSGFYVTGINYNYNDVERKHAGLFRYNKNGSMLWAKYYSSEIGKRILFDDNGIIMLTNRKLIKTNLDGDSIWVRDFSFKLATIIYYTSSSLEDMIRTADGGYVIGGYSLEGYKDKFVPDESTNYKIIKTDNNGIERWNKSFSVGVRNEYLLSIIETKDSGLILCGTSNDHYNATGDTWLVKTDSTGKQQTCTQMLEKNTVSNTYCPPHASAFKYYYSAPHDSSKFYSFTWTLNDTLLQGENELYTQLLKSGTYRAYATDSLTGCQDSSGSMIVAFDPPPTGFTGGPDLVRCRSGSGSINLALQGKPSGGSWAGPLRSEGTDFINPNTLGAGTYQYVFSRILNTSSCIFRDTILIVLDTVKPAKPIITSNKAQPMCKGDTVKLSIPQGYIIATWSTRNINSKSDSLVAKYKDSTLAWVFATKPGLVCRDSASYKISFRPLEPAPLIAGPGPLEFCEGDSTLMSSPATYDHYLWSTGDTTKDVYAKVTTYFQLKARNNNTCLSNWSNLLAAFANPRPATPAIIRSSATTLKSSEFADSYNWYLNDSLLPYHTREITAFSSGSYKVTTQMIDFDCESLPSDIYVFETTALGESIPASFYIYPNPAGKFIAIENIHSTQSTLSIKVYSIIGEQLISKEISTNQKLELDISQLIGGNYILVIEGGDAVYRKVFVKE